MMHGIRTVVYPVTDLDRARAMCPNSQDHPPAQPWLAGDGATVSHFVSIMNKIPMYK